MYNIGITALADITGEHYSAGVGWTSILVLL